MHGYKRRRLGNDYRKLLALYGHMAKPGEYTEHIIQHDGWCRHFKGKPCNCDPDIIWSPSSKQLDELRESASHTMSLIVFTPPKVH